MGVTLNIDAAASLNNVLSDPGFQAALFAYTSTTSPGTGSNITALNITAASSGYLANQIAGGAKPDIFFSAATAPMSQLAADSPPLVTNVNNVLRNSLVLIRKSNYTLTPPIVSFGQIDLLNPSNVSIFVADTQTWNTPAGFYAQQAFQYFGKWTWVEQNATITTMQNVTYVYNAVAGAGRPAVGAVYFTDAVQAEVQGTSNPVSIIAQAPTTVNDNIIYPVAQVTTGANQAAAADFVSFVTAKPNPITPANAMYYFLKWGFLPY